MVFANWKMSLVQATFRHAEHNATPPHYVLNNIYQLPEVEDDEDEDFKQQTQTLKNMIPFAVVGSSHPGVVVNES